MGLQNILAQMPEQQASSGGTVRIERGDLSLRVETSDTTGNTGIRGSVREKFPVQMGDEQVVIGLSIGLTNYNKNATDYSRAEQFGTNVEVSDIDLWSSDPEVVELRIPEVRAYLKALTENPEHSDEDIESVLTTLWEKREASEEAQAQHGNRYFSFRPTLGKDGPRNVMFTGCTIEREVTLADGQKAVAKERWDLARPNRSSQSSTTASTTTEEAPF